MPFSKHITTLLVSILGFNIYFSNIITLSQSMLPTGSFFVSEINWNGSWVKDTVTNQFKSSSDDEWIEFYNSSDKTISLNDFNIKGFSSSNKDLSYKNNSKCIILPKSYFVVSRLDSSPTVDNSTGCVAANMSISNTNINYSITDKVSQTIDSGLIGDPNKITLSKNTFKKFSI